MTAANKPAVPARKGALNEKGQIDELTENINVGGHKELIYEGENAFGGKNPVGLYVPMSDDEQEVLHRLKESKDLELVVHGWGTIPNPVMVVGDHRVRIDFTMFFKGLLVSQPLHYLDLELKLGSGMSIYRNRLPIPQYGGQPYMVTEGDELQFQWDIAISHMDPEFVRAIKPGATGLTSLRQDKDTREMTSEGNMRLDDGKRKLLRKLEAGQASLQEMDRAAAVRASVAAGDKLVKSSDGVHYKPTSKR